MDTEHGFSYMTMNTRLASTAQKTGIQLQRYEQNKDIRDWDLQGWMKYKSKRIITVDKTTHHKAGPARTDTEQKQANLAIIITEQTRHHRSGPSLVDEEQRQTNLAVILTVNKTRHHRPGPTRMDTGQKNDDCLTV